MERLSNLLNYTAVDGRAGTRSCVLGLQIRYCVEPEQLTVQVLWAWVGVRGGGNLRQGLKQHRGLSLHR